MSRVCFNCEERTSTCHATCERYRAEYDENQLRYARQHAEQEIIGSLIEAKTAAFKRKRNESRHAAWRKEY